MNKKEKLTKKLEILSKISGSLSKEQKLKALKDFQKCDEIVNKKLHK